LVLLSIRRGVDLWTLMTVPETQLDPSSEVLAMIVAALCLWGVAAFEPFFTEVQRSALALARIEDRYRALARVSPVGIFYADAQGSLTSTNARWCDITGRSVAEARGDGWLESVQVADRDRVRNAWRRCMSSRAPFEAEFGITGQGVHADWVWCLAVPEGTTPDSDWVGVLVDLTERLRAGRERDKLQSRLLEAEKLETLGTVAAWMAHDFNNLLAVIQGNCELAMDAVPASNPAHDRMATIERTCQKSAGLVRQLLASSGQAKVQLGSVDVAQQVGSVLDLLAVRVPDHVHIERKFGAALPPVLADPTQLDQVVLNLAINAIEACGDQGYVSVSVRAVDPTTEGQQERHMPLDAQWVALEVTDSGCGMTGSTLKHIFQPFFSTKQSGRGLGLAAVSGIVRSHGGKLRVRSGIGQGTTFEILWPTAPPDDAPRSRGTLAANERILVVDDNPSVRDVLRDFLGDHGTRVAAAADGSGALQLFQASPDAFAFAIIDIVLPGKSGHDVALELRKLRPQLPVLMMSGYPAPEVTERLLAGGPAEYLCKRRSGSRRPVGSDATCLRHLLWAPAPLG
jgi:PAS domain S-box-containing protein